MIDQVVKANQKIDEKRDVAKLDKEAQSKLDEPRKSGKHARDFMSSSSSGEEDSESE